MLMTLGRKELEDIISEHGKIEVGCQFCDKKYTYLAEDLDSIFSK